MSHCGKHLFTYELVKGLHAEVLVSVVPRGYFARLYSGHKTLAETVICPTPFSALVTSKGMMYGLIHNGRLRKVDQNEGHGEDDGLLL